MTIITHIVATTVAVKVLGLHGSDAALAYVFGVGQDIDHAIKLPFYLKHVGMKNKKGYYWRSSLQEPVAFLWILPLCIVLGTWIPALFFGIHLALDYSVGYEKMPFFPYSGYVTCGWFTRLSDRTKEVAILTTLAFVGVLLYVRV